MTCLSWFKPKNLKCRHGQSGQSLIEYLILVALVGIASMAVVRSLSAVVDSKYKEVTASLNGTQKSYRVRLPSNDQVRRRDMGDFNADTAQADQ